MNRKSLLPFLFFIETTAEHPKGGTGEGLSLKKHEIEGHIVGKHTYRGSRGVVQE